MVHPSASNHPAIRHGKIGVLIVNLGTPDDTGYWPMRRYLKEFLSDRRVIEVNPVIWWFILNGPVLTKRPFSSGEAYRSIWNSELDESPLRTITRSQAEILAGNFNDEPRIMVDWAMRYGNPSIPARLKQLQQQGCERILLVPLYPQYSAATTATVCDKAFDALKAMRLAAEHFGWRRPITTIQSISRRLPHPSGHSSPRSASSRSWSSPPIMACRSNILRKATPITATA